MSKHATHCDCCGEPVALGYYVSHGMPEDGRLGDLTIGNRDADVYIRVSDRGAGLLITVHDNDQTAWGGLDRGDATLIRDQINAWLARHEVSK